MMRLLHITTVPMTLRFLKGQIGYLKERGFDVHALSSPGEDLVAFGREEGIPSYTVHMPRRITPLKDLVALLNVIRVINRVKPTIVHAHTPKGGLLGIVAAWITRVPVRVYHVHGLPMDTAQGLRRLLLATTERLSCMLATQVLCVSPSVRKVVVARGLCQADKIKVLGRGSINGVDADGRFHPKRTNDFRHVVRRKYGVPNGAPVVGYIGRIVRDKGIVELAKAWQQLRKEVPDAHLLIVGPQEKQDPLPDSVIKQLEADPRVHLVGPNWDTPPLYAAMDVVVLPSHREGLPVVPLEAAAMALPVIGTKIPGCQDAIQDGVTGRLVGVGDIGALTQAMRTYLTNPALRQEHGNAGRERMLRDFRQQVIWDETYREYVRLLKKAGYAPVSAGPLCTHERDPKVGSIAENLSR